MRQPVSLRFRIALGAFVFAVGIILATAVDAVAQEASETLQQPKSQVWETPAETEVQQAKAVPFPFEGKKVAEPENKPQSEASVTPIAPAIAPNDSIPPTTLTPEQVGSAVPGSVPPASPFTKPKVSAPPVETAEPAKTAEPAVPESATPTAAKEIGSQLDETVYDYSRMLSERRKTEPSSALKPRYTGLKDRPEPCEPDMMPLDPCAPNGKLRRPYASFRTIDGRPEYCARGPWGRRLQSGLSPYFFDFWVSQGTTLNFHWPEGESNRPIRYNDVAGEYMLNQVYLTFGRQIRKTANHWDWGFRADLLYGSDYLDTSSIGLETYKYTTYGGITMPQYDPALADLRWNSDEGPRRNVVNPAAMYGLSMPQLYGELYAPTGTTFRVGHFYSQMGIESPMAPYNFFYSHSYSFMYGMPTTFTGMTLTQQLTRRLSIMGGMTQGWDIWESPNESVGWVGGLEWNSLDRRSRVAFTLSSARQSDRDDYRTNYSLIFSHRLSRRWTYMLEHTLGYEENASIYSLTSPQDLRIGRWYSITQYLQWQLNDKWAVGFRGEWFRDEGHSRILRWATNSAANTVRGNDYYGLTLGVNWRPTRFIMIRPEVRYDWSDVRVVNNSDPSISRGIYNNTTKGEQITFGIDATVRF